MVPLQKSWDDFFMTGGLRHFSGSMQKVLGRCSAVVNGAEMFEMLAHNDESHMTGSYVPPVVPMCLDQVGFGKFIIVFHLCII